MADEVAAAREAKVEKRGEETIFGKILNGTIPCNFIYEDDKVIEWVLT